MNAREVAENIALGLRDVLPEATIDLLPVADGGEGTSDVICAALGGTWTRCGAHDALGRDIAARFAYIAHRNLAVIDMSETAGMRRLTEKGRDPLRATTFGVGEMILAATCQGAKEVVVGLGGSATNDGGFGMARALGFRFFAQGRKRQLRSAPLHLRELTHIESPRNLILPKIIAAADVRNPLLGPSGATRVFGPQKGANPDDIEILERALTRLADAAMEEFGSNFRNEPGAGAAGGLGFGLMTFCGAAIRPGFGFVAETIDLQSKLKDADVVITGEGSLDSQTLHGKAPGAVAQMARQQGKRVFALVGRVEDNPKVREMFDGVYVLAGSGVDEQESIARAPMLLRESARELAMVL